MKQFKLYYTSDVHGYLLPTDYIQAGAQPLGLANAATHFQKDAQTLIIDGGDMFQGSPMLQYLQQQPAQDAVTTAMNLAGYDYVTLGNHDFNYGKKYTNLIFEFHTYDYRKFKSQDFTDTVQEIIKTLKNDRLLMITKNFCRMTESNF